MILANTLAHPVQVRLPHLVTDAAAGPPAPPEAASTYGWDTAFAIRLPDVNRAIARSGVSPTTFSYTPADRSCSLDGRFGTWQVRPGGDGALVYLGIPVVKGWLDWQGTRYPMDGALATVEVKLNYLPPDPTDDTSRGTPHRLVVRTADPAGEPVASVTNLALPGDGPGFIPRALMAGGLEEWLNANLAEFSHVFAVVDLNRIVDREQFRWLAPTSTSYAYVNGADEESSHLGVLCMTGHRDPGELAPQISSRAIPTGSRSGFLISADRLLQDMIRPALPHAFPGATDADFAMSPDGTAVVNVRPVATPTVEHAGTTYQPWIGQLRITVNTAEVVVDTVTTVDLGLGTTAHVKNVAYQKIRLATSPNGTQTLVWEPSRPPVADHWTTMDEGTSIAIEVVGLVIAAVLTVLTDGAALVVALIIVALVVGLVEATPQQIADTVGQQVSDASVSLSLLVLNSTDPIVWSGAREFRLDQVGLDGALRLGGTPQFAE